MSSRLALLGMAAALGCAFALTAPALAQVVIDGKEYGLVPQPDAEYGTVPADGAQSDAVPQEAPPPPPSGCPYRDRKLELIV